MVIQGGGTFVVICLNESLSRYIWWRLGFELYLNRNVGGPIIIIRKLGRAIGSIFRDSEISSSVWILLFV